MHIERIGGYLDHFFSQTRAHHVQLSTMADWKANMLLTAASLVLTFSIRYLEEPRLQYAAVTLIVFCMLTIITAIYTTMPKFPTRYRPKPDLSNPSFNLLFFGSFVDMEYSQYAAAMENVVNDPDKIFEAMTREIFLLGNFLAYKKYRYLRWAYMLFLAGMLTSGFVLIMTQVWFGFAHPTAHHG